MKLFGGGGGLRVYHEPIFPSWSEELFSHLKKFVILCLSDYSKRSFISTNSITSVSSPTRRWRYGAAPPPASPSSPFTSSHTSPCRSKIIISNPYWSVILKEFTKKLLKQFKKKLKIKSRNKNEHFTLIENVHLNPLKWRIENWINKPFLINLHLIQLIHFIQIIYSSNFKVNLEVNRCTLRQAFINSVL